MLQGALHMRHNAIADLFAVTLSLNEACLSENAEMMGNVRLRTVQLRDEIADAFFLRE